MPNTGEPIIAVRVRAPVASFRRPLDHNYQRTLPMPPPTTLIGIAGAALGLSDRELWAPDSPVRHLSGGTEGRNPVLTCGAWMRFP